MEKVTMGHKKVIKAQTCIGCKGRGYVIDSNAARARTCIVCGGTRVTFMRVKKHKPELKIIAGTHPVFKG